MTTHLYCMVPDSPTSPAAAAAAAAAATPPLPNIQKHCLPSPPKKPCKIPPHLYHMVPHRTASKVDVPVRVTTSRRAQAVQQRRPRGGPLAPHALASSSSSSTAAAAAGSDGGCGGSTGGCTGPHL
jgi:hypothetical protein